MTRTIPMKTIVCLTLLIAVLWMAPVYALDMVYPDATLGDWNSGNGLEIWDLTKGDITLYYTLDMSGIANPGWSLVEVGLRQVGAPNLDPNLQGGWLMSVYRDSLSDPDLRNNNDYHVLMKHGWLYESYDVKGDGSLITPISIPSYINHGFHFDRDGVDPWQANEWSNVDGGTYNTGGVYDVCVTYHALSASQGTMFVTINGEEQGLYTGGYINAAPQTYPIGRTFDGDMTQLQVFWGRGSGGGTVAISGIAVMQEDIVDFGSIVLTGNGLSKGHFPVKWNLTCSDLVLQLTYDGTGLLDEFGGNAAHAWAELGIRELGYGDFNPSGVGAWMTTDYDWAANTFDPDSGGDTQDLDDKLLLQSVGGQNEGAYNLPASPSNPGANHRFWFDRDGVDQWQALNPLAVDGGTYNTGGTYDIELRYHATSATTGEVFMTINGLAQGFEEDGNWQTMELSPAGMTFAGDMSRMEVFYGLYGYNNVSALAHTVSFVNIVATGCLADNDAPIVSDLLADANPVAVNSTSLLTAVADDSGTGNSDIASVEYSLDDGATWQAMAPSDTAFDSPTETAEADLVFADVGVYEVLVRATDALANTSAEESVLVVVYDPDGGFVTGGGWIDSPAGAYYETFPDVVWFQGFESNTDGWLDLNSGWYGLVTQVATGTDGVSSFEGASHAIMEGDASSGPFTRFDGYRDTWPGDYLASIAVYLDVNWPTGTGFDYSVASSGSDGLHQRDFIFHVTKDTSTGKLLVAGSNNTNFAPREDLENINHYEVTQSGWYIFEHAFRDDGGALAVDLNLRDSAGTLLFTETRYNAADVIPDEVGGNRYGWFTFINVPDGIAVDEHALILPQSPTGKATFAFVSRYKKGATIPTGNTVFQFNTACFSFKSTSYDWLVLSGAKAMYKGVGTVNGSGSYKFMLTGIDADVNTSDSFDIDRFRIRIWSEDEYGNEFVLYDNGLGSSDDDDMSATEISGGSIVIHKSK